MTVGACAACGRTVRLRATSDAGRICSACAARANHGVCPTCGRDGVFNGRNPEGLPWCRSCFSRARAAATAERQRQVILAAVVKVEPQLPAEAVRAAITTAIGARSPRVLCAILQANPDVLTQGPTSDPLVLDRFVQALIDTGSARLGTIHPTCVVCGRPRRRTKRVQDGSLCAACKARSAGKPPCSLCGQHRRAYDHDPDGLPRCASCVRRPRAKRDRRRRHRELAHQISQRTGCDQGTVIEVIAALRLGPEKVIALTRALIDLDHPDQSLPPMTTDLASTLVHLGVDLDLTCNRCGLAVTKDHHRSKADGILCQACHQRCLECARDTMRSGERCWRCRPTKNRRRGSCQGCPGVDRLLDDRGLCRWCRERSARTCPDCGARGQPQTRTADSPLVCPRCALRRDLDRVLPPHHPGALQLLRAPILAVASPATTRSWLNRPEIAELLAGMSSGALPATHDTLDAQPPSRGIEHLRHLLTAAGALPAEPERPITHLLSHSEQLLDGFCAADANAVRGWLRWQIVPGLRARIDGPTDSIAALRNATRTLRVVIAFLDTLHANGRTLADCQQSDVDQWFTVDRPARRFVNSFLSWAQGTKILPKTITLPRWGTRTAAPLTDHAERAAVCRRIMSDDTLNPADRVAGALVAIYAQPVVRICSLRTSDLTITPTAVSLTLGSATLDLPTPLSELIQQLPVPRRGGIAEALQGDWLFPGASAGQHIEPASLANRLRKIGIRPRHLRRAALNELSHDIAPALLASALGLNPSTVVSHSTRSGADWSRYAAHPRP